MPAWVCVVAGRSSAKVPVCGHRQARIKPAKAGANTVITGVIVIVIR